MKAAIIGHGKMGREIEKILLERGHRIGAVIDEANASELDAAHLVGIDVALEFTTPDAAYGNIRACIDAGIPVVSGTTGWTNRLEELRSYCREKDGALFYASNYCLGVNLMFRLNRRLARMMERSTPTTYGSKRFTTPRKRTLRAARPSRWQKGSSAKSGARRAG